MKSSGQDANAATSRLTFMLEDTNEGCYRDVSATLVSRGYAPVAFERRAKQKKKKAQFKYGVVPSFIWAINERDIDFTELLSFQVVNHFEGISKLTTKQGLCEILRGMPWVDEHDHDVSPRAYDLSIPSQRAEFADDFRLSAASNILKHCSVKKTLSAVNIFGVRVIRFAITAITVYLSTALHGDWSGMLLSGALGILDRGDFGLLDGEWAEVLRASYDMAAVDGLPEWCLGEIHQRDDILLPSVTQLKIRLLLRGLQQVWPQLYMSGMRNIWIVKAPVVSRGTGIKLCSKLEDIFDLEKRIAGRIVQKYVETPLLIPKTSSYLNMNSNLSAQVKFDTRIWVVVTSFQPLRAQIYSKIYGRRCTKPYSTSLKTLHDDFIHLTNYSVQKNASGSGSLPSSLRVSSAADASDEVSPASLVDKLRGAVKTPQADLRKSQVASSAIDDTNSDLLVTHNEFMDFLDFKCNGKGREVWEMNVWPEIKRRVASLLMASREHVSHRDKSFELLGVDVIFDDRLVPWVLEANMSPGLSHRNEQHNTLIAHMIETMMQQLLGEKPGLVAGSSIAPSYESAESASSLGMWQVLDTSTPEVSVSPPKERWTGIPVNIPNSRYHLISGEGKINKTWIGVLKSGSLSTTSVLPSTEFQLAADDEVSVSEKSYLRDKFSGLKNTSFLRETEEDDAKRPVISKDMEIIAAVTTPYLLDSTRERQMAPSEGWSKSLRGSRPSSATCGSSRSRFITSSKKDLLKVANAVVGLTGSSDTSNMTATEARLHYYNQINTQCDPSSIIAVGKSISKRYIASVDCGIRTTENVYLLQRWARRYLARLRAYHLRRQYAAIVLQCLFRRVYALMVLDDLARQKAAVALQTHMRMLFARLELERRRRKRASSKIEGAIYKYIIKIRKYKLLLNGSALTIQRNLRWCMSRYFDRNAHIIGRIARRWLKIRWRHRLVVRHLIGLNYRHKVRIAMIIKRSPIFKIFLKFLQTKRRRRRHLLRILTAQARKPNKGLRHVIKVNVKHHVVVIDHGDAFSPLFKYNNSMKGEPGIADEEFPTMPEVADTFDLKKANSSSETTFTPAASKALALVNSILQNSEEAQKRKRDEEEIMEAIMTQSDRELMKEPATFKGQIEVRDILDFVLKHADGNGNNELKPSPKPHQKPKSLSFKLDAHSPPPPLPLEDTRSSPQHIAVTALTSPEVVEMAAKSDVDVVLDAAMDSEEEEDLLFRRCVSLAKLSNEDADIASNEIKFPFTTKDLPMKTHMSRRPSQEGELTLDGLVEDKSWQENNCDFTDEYCLLAEMERMHRRHRHRNHELDTPKLRHEYEVPPQLSVVYPPQRVEDQRCSPPYSPDLINEMDEDDDYIYEQEQRLQKSKPSNRTSLGKCKTKAKSASGAKKSKSATSLRGPIKLPPRDPDEIYREQLEKQLSDAKARYAQKQMRRQADALYRHSEVIRGDSAPFNTNIRPREAVWDTRNTTRGVTTKMIEGEKAVALQQGAQWDSDLQLQLEEKERKQRRAVANEEHKKAATALEAAHLAKDQQQEDARAQRIKEMNPFMSPPARKVRTKTRPKSAGNAGNRPRLRNDVSRNNAVGEWPDESGGILMGVHAAPIQSSLAPSEFGSASAPRAPNSPPTGRSSGRRPTHRESVASGGRPEYAAGGNIDSHMAPNNIRDIDGTNTKTPLKTKRPKSAGPVGASERRQAARKAQRSGDICDSMFADASTGRGPIHRIVSELDAPNGGYSDSLWTAKAGANAIAEFTSEDISRIEEELTNTDLFDDSRKSAAPQDVNLDSDSGDDLDAAMEKWIKKQDLKARNSQQRQKREEAHGRPYISSRLNITDDPSVPSSYSQGKSSASRFDFDEPVGNRAKGPFRGASDLVAAVSSGFSAHTTPGVKIPVVAHLHQQFTPVSELNKERQRRRFQEETGYTPSYEDSLRDEERRAQIFRQDVPIDTYQTYTYERRPSDDRDRTDIQFVESGQRTRFNDLGAFDPSIIGRIDNKYEHSTQIDSANSRSNAYRAANVFQEGDHGAYYGLPPRVGDGRRNARPRSSNTAGNPQYVAVGDHNSEEGANCSDDAVDPLQVSVQKLRTAYTSLTWDF